MAKGDLISRKRLLDELRAELKECKKDAAEYGGESILWAEGLEFAIDAVEVVRCEDCKHNDMNGGDCNRTMAMCRRDHVLELNVYEYIKLEHCSYGERKTE